MIQGVDDASCLGHLLLEKLIIASVEILTVINRTQFPLYAVSAFDGGDLKMLFLRKCASGVLLVLE